MKFREVVRVNYVDIIFYIIAFTAIGVFIGISTAIFLLFFLLLFALVSYSAIGVYNTVRGTKDKWLLLKILGTIAVSAIMYFLYGIDALLKTVLYSLVISAIILLFVIFYVNRNK